MKKSEQIIQKLYIKSSVTDRVIRALAVHPYLWTMVICLIIHPFFFGASGNVPKNVLMIETIIFLSIGFAFIFYLYKCELLNKFTAIVSGVIFVILVLLLVKWYSTLHVKSVVFFFTGCLCIFVLWYFAQNDEYKEQLNVFLIISLGFILKLYYVYLCSCYTYQHDVHSFGKPNGHAGYIEYLLFNHKLPDFDPRTIWQYYHPPLHYVICALWIDLNENIFGIGHMPSRESLQTLTLFYSMCIVITSYRIFKQFKLKGFALYIPTLIIAFHPAFILFSGSINNDVLSVAFMMGALLCTVRWYREQKFVDLMKIAFCVGLGMMTKLSVAIIAPPIAIVFLIVFIKNIRANGKSDAVRMIKEFSLFGVISIPLGLWFEIRNFIKWKVPFLYVQQMSKTSSQYLGDIDFVQRITDFSLKQFASPFEQWTKGTVYKEFNPLVAIFKNSLFGEYINEKNYGLSILPNGVLICQLFFWIGVIIATACFCLMIFNLCIKCGLTPTEKTLFVSFYAFMMIIFYKMQFDYPFICTMNFRYITPTVLIGAFFLGITLQNLNLKNKKIERTIKISSMTVVALFALLSVIIYMFVCLPKVK